MEGRSIREEERPRTQARGRRRRARLVEAAKELLDERDLDGISLADIAERAGIPKGSAYHFFPTVHAVFQGVAEQFAAELGATVSAPYIIPEGAHWANIFDQAVDRAIVIYEKSPAYRQLIIGGKAPSEIKRSDRSNDELIGQLLMDAIQQHFMIPAVPGIADVFFYAVGITDLFLMLSMIRENRIANEMVAEAKKAARAYLYLYVPSELPRRRSPDAAV